MKINTIVIGIFLVSILVLSGCATKLGKLELESVTPTSISYSKYGLNSVPIEITVKNIGNDDCMIESASINTFWNGPNGDSSITKTVSQRVIPNEKYTFVLQGYIPQSLIIDNSRGSSFPNMNERTIPVSIYVYTNEGCGQPIGGNRAQFYAEKIFNFVE